MEYIHHFSDHSADYLHYRPDYPDELFDYLTTLVTTHELAWDCATGNGQAALKLANYFNEVFASDISQAQLDNAQKKNNIHYYCWPAKKTELADHTVDLITVAQALHWFNLEAFYCEVRRVAKSTGIIAAWCYSLGTINPAINVLIERLYHDILGDAYWPKERKYIDAMYKTIPFPFQKLSTPYFSIEKQINFTHLLGYLNTWSAVKEYQKQMGTNPIDSILLELQNAWGDAQKTHMIHWPLHLLVGKIE